MLRSPNVPQLVSAARTMAMAMQLQPVAPATFREIIVELLFKPQPEGGKDIWGCYTAGLITRAETRDLLIANLATWTAHANDTREPWADQWETAALEAAFERALFGSVNEDA